MLKKIIFLSLAVMLFLPIATFAADSATTTSQGLTVSPPVFEATIKPGDTQAVTIKLTNPTDSILTLYPSAVDFTSGDDAGNPVFLPTNETSRTYSLSAWMKYSPSPISIAPKQVVNWEYDITVPTDGGPGGHYGSVMFGSKPPEDSTKVNQVGVASTVAAIALINVPGDVKENAYISEFSTGKLYYSSLPVEITTKIANVGNTHVVPTGKISIKSMFGSKVAEYQLNESKGRILPEGNRKFTTKWESPGGPFYKQPIGRYTVELSGIYGENTKYALNESIAFWIVPIWAIVSFAILILITATTIIIVSVRKKKAA